MKLSKCTYITFLCAVFCFAWSTQDKLHISIPTPQVLELRQVAEKCEKETGIPASHLRKIIDKTLPNDDNNNNFFFCIVKDARYADESGHFLVEKFAPFQVVDGKNEDFANAIKDCNKITKEDPKKTLLAAADCLHGKYHFAPAAKQ